MGEITLPREGTFRKPVTDLEVGKAAEHLVCTDLIMQGYRAYLSDQGLAYDVVVDLDGKLVRIQVKGTRQLRALPQRRVLQRGYLFHCKRAGKGGRRRYGAGEFDMLALVALDIRVVAYLPVIDVPTQCVMLREPGYRFRANATRLRNIDQWPFEEAAMRFLGLTGKAATLDGDGRTFDELRAERLGAKASAA